MITEDEFISEYLANHELAVRYEELPLPAQEGFDMSSITKYLNIITVEERNGYVRVAGITSKRFALDVKKLWQTSKIVQYMFTKLSSKEIIMPSFFALEFRYMLIQLIDSGQAYSRNTMRHIVDLLEKNTWLKNIVAPPTNQLLDFNELSKLNLS